MEIDCQHILQYDKDLYRQLEMYPTEILQMIDLVCSLIAKENARQDAITGITEHMQTGVQQDADMEDIGLIQACPFHLSVTFKVRDLTPQHIDKYVQVKGIVIRNSDIIPEMNVCGFKCDKCGFVLQEQIDRNKTFEPSICPNQECKGRGTFDICHEHCQFTARQYVKLQETPESVPEGEAPQTMQVMVHDDLVDTIKPGDRVEVCGIYRASGVRINAERRTQLSIFKTYIDVVIFVKADKKRF